MRRIGFVRTSVSFIFSGLSSLIGVSITPGKMQLTRDPLRKLTSFVLPLHRDGETCLAQRSLAPPYDRVRHSLVPETGQRLMTKIGSRVGPRAYFTRRRTRLAYLSNKQGAQTMYQFVSHAVRRVSKSMLFGIMIMSVPLAAMAADVNPSPVNPNLSGSVKDINKSVKDINKSVVAPTALKPGTVVKPGYLQKPGTGGDAAICICEISTNTCTPKGCWPDFPSERKIDAATLKNPTQTMTTPRH